MKRCSQCLTAESHTWSYTDILQHRSNKQPHQ
uniref:Uncharacterized protein n=1 Tax=Anguilla anguilla TaxID=7936 RepID=A0A0E9W8P1_ANGAN